MQYWVWIVGINEFALVNWQKLIYWGFFYAVFGISKYGKNDWELCEINCKALFVFFGKGLNKHKLDRRARSP